MSNFNKIIEHYREIAHSKRDTGDRFEHLIKRYLLSYQVYGNDKVEKIWLWNDWPYKSKLGNHDTGIDLIALTKEGDYWAIQCKCYAAESTIDKASVDSFLATSGKTWIDDQNQLCVFKLCIFVSTTNKWSANAESAFKNRTTEFFKINLSFLETSAVNWQLLSEGSMGSKVLTDPYTLRPHQQEALDKVHEYFKTNERGKLIMACGTGKTFTALKIAEHEAGSKGFVLFLVPNISLLRQVFLEWRHHSKYDINFVWICSDPTASRNDELTYDISELPWKATTDVTQIINNINRCFEKPGMTVVFSTYQSIDVVYEAQLKIDKCFDLIICDEAHRTTGVTLSDQDNNKSNFIKIHNSEFIKGNKRLYMTATPLIYHNTLKAKLDLKNHTYVSMDDDNYGQVIYRLSFGEAVKKDLLTNYHLMVLSINKKDLDQEAIKYLLANATLSKSKNDNLEQNIIKLLGCVNALKKVIIDNDEVKAEIGTESMQRAVAFCDNIQDSKDIKDLFNEIKAYDNQHRLGTYVVSADHMDGKMSTTIRDGLLKWLESDKDDKEGRVLTNVRCLNEGIDVPALDAVLFLSAQSSKINIVQSIGRVMRQSPGKNFGYIIIPIIVDSQEKSGDKIFQTNYPKYQIIWNVINALHAHDESFDNEISKLTYTLGKYNKHDRLIVGRVQKEGLEINVVDDQGKINDHIKNFREAIAAKTVSQRQRFWLRWVGEINKIYESQKKQINFALLKDLNFRRIFNQYHGLFKLSHNEKTLPEFINMIAQHVVMKPVFQALFKNIMADTNPVNVYLDTVVNQLKTTTSDDDQKKLDKFYESVKQNVNGIETSADKETLIKDIYEKFFTIAFPKEVKKLGIVYTPMPVVDFILKSVADLLPIHFQNKTLNDQGVYIIDPFVGTGSFISRLINKQSLIDNEHILHKYQHEIYANEITLLAYYIASISIVNSFYNLKIPEARGVFTNFWGMNFIDTFQITEKNYHDYDYFYKTFYKNNSPMYPNRPPITIIIGNPPYSVSKNTSYPILDKRIADTYMVQSITKGTSSLYDSYYKAFRWSTDRLHPVGGGDYRICY